MRYGDNRLSYFVDFVWHLRKSAVKNEDTNHLQAQWSDEMSVGDSQRFTFLPACSIMTLF